MRLWIDRCNFPRRSRRPDGRPIPALIVSDGARLRSSKGLSKAPTLSFGVNVPPTGSDGATSSPRGTSAAEPDATRHTLAAIETMAPVTCTILSTMPMAAIT